MAARDLFPGFGQLARPVPAAEGRSGVVAFVGPQEVLQLPLGAPLGRESAYFSSPGGPVGALLGRKYVFLGPSGVLEAQLGAYLGKKYVFLSQKYVFLGLQKEF